MNNHLSNILDGVIKSHSKNNYCDITTISLKDIKQLSQTLFTFDEHFREVVKSYIDKLIQSRIPYICRPNSIGEEYHDKNRN